MVSIRVKENQCKEQRTRKLESALYLRAASRILLVSFKARTVRGPSNV